MEIIEKMLIERECERLVTQYCHFVDHDEAARIADLFTEDATCRLTKVSMTGREQIRAGFQRRQDNKGRMSRHVCNNLLIDVVSSTEAIGTVYLTLYRYDGEAGRRISPLDGPEMVGEYRDRFVKTGDGWRIAHRSIVIDFQKDRR